MMPFRKKAWLIKALKPGMQLMSNIIKEPVSLMEFLYLAWGISWRVIYCPLKAPGP